ncbi:MAG TPA: hypothetical protein VF381_06500 [Thermoanaerobaculia bacterium]
MIIPRGTEIKVNAQGQLSIRTPGNLVIQNSGNYSEIESTNGSIRIDENVTVEAVSIRAGQACFIQGTLTAWRVHAKKITLEDRAKAFIMLQESESLELSRTARLVGNFANEKELFLMMGKFTGQLKELPGAVDMGMQSTLERPVPQHSIAASRDDAPLRAAQTLIERELTRPDLSPRDSEALREVLYALREHNVSRIGSIYRSAFAEIRNASEPLKEAFDHLESFFAANR